MRLYSFFRSSTSHRLRVALNLKGVRYDYEAVDLRAEHHLAAAHKAVHRKRLLGLAAWLPASSDQCVQRPIRIGTTA